MTDDRWHNADTAFLLAMQITHAVIKRRFQMPPHAHAFCSILPPHILRKLADKAEMRDRVLRDIATNERLRGIRQAFAMPLLATQPGPKRRTIYDAQTTTNLPGTQVLDEGGPASADIAVTEAYNYSGDTYDFYLKVFNRNSVDDHGLTLTSTVHYDQGYDNAFWNGQQMIYGDGDGQYFQRFTICLDVIGHELTHGVTQNEAQLLYRDQSGALNESISDVFGSLVKQWANNQTVDDADWLIGAGLFTAAVHGKALRSMADPGTAYDDPNIGKDPQPADMSGYVTTTDDNGGVHINSGIPNRAFYLAAKKIGGYAWQKAGLIWYRALNGSLKPSANFQDMANATMTIAGSLFGQNGAEQQAVADAWSTVGVAPTVSQFRALSAPAKPDSGNPKDSANPKEDKAA
jgi:Zn-dependent metalloprotease